MALILMGLLLVCSGIVSGTETAVFSLGAAERRRLVSSSAYVAGVLARPGRMLVTLLLANLFINVGYFSVSASLSLALLARGELLMSWAVNLGSVLALVVAAEIVPKTVALAAPQRVVSVMAPVVLAMRLVLAPMAALAGGATWLLESLLMGRRPGPERPGAADFKTALSSRGAMGLYHTVELALLHDVVDFGSRRARNLMTPRVDVVFLDVEDSAEQWADTMAGRPHRDYPVCDGSPDHLLGTVNTARLLAQPSGDPRELVEPALYAPLSIEADRLVRRLIDEGRHLAVLLDEHGGVAGVVGLAALTRSVLGEIAPRTEEPGDPLQVRAGGTLMVRGDCPLHVLTDETGMDLMSRRADTVGGALAEAMGRVPRVGDELRLEGWRLRVVAMRRGRVQSVLVRASSPEEDEA